ncbi:ABC transporter ATP-binding protein [Bradyrhizobium sp. 31Argb]|uniref:ABC transporter ATP-binding protein n=1 Tax=Bradyrhizobium sp. 31Argb TaxID=3141247 RepID=UPI003749D373
MLSVRSLHRNFGGLAAVADVSFDVGEGEFVGIIGPNGAGKTTLLNLITGYQKPNAGKILFRGRDIAGLRPYRVKRLKIARTFQVVQPFNEMTVRENVEVGARFGRAAWLSNSEVEEDCARALELAGLSNVAGMPAGALTLGEKKRLELARSLASRPELLLLDEVMGGLSSREVRDLVQALKRIHASGVTVIMIEHVLHALFQLVARVLVLDFGRKIGDGDPSAIMSQPEV